MEDESSLSTGSKIMRKLLIAALVAGQVPGAAAPAFSQGFAPVRETETGAFAGLRVRLAFGGTEPQPLRAGLAFAPTTRADYQDGRVRTRIGEGMEFGYRTSRPVSLSVAGRDLSSFRLNAVQDQDERGRGGSTGRTLLIVGGVLVVAVGVGALVLFDAMEDASE